MSEREQVTVLVVDDDEDIRYSLQQVLGMEGYRVVLARDGREALQKLEQQPVDLILLDLMMPGMNGWEFRERQLAEPHFAEVPVVVVSGANVPSSSLAHLRVVEYLGKPVDLDELLAVIERHQRRAPTVSASIDT